MSNNDLQMLMGGGGNLLLRRRMMMQSEGGVTFGIEQGAGAYIPLGYYVTPNTRIELDIQFGEVIPTPEGVKDIPGPLFSSEKVNNSCTTLLCGGNPSTQTLRSWYLYYSTTLTRQVGRNLSNNRVTFIVGKQDTSYIMWVGATHLTITAKPSTDTTPLALLYNFQGSSGFEIFQQSELCVVWSVKFYEDDVLSAEYLPDEQNGVVGLTERISQVFYPPQGGVFTKYYSE